MLIHHSGADLKINLQTDHIIFHGSIEEAAGKVIRGSVILDCHEHMKVKGISLKFSGRVKVHWVEGAAQRHYKDKKTLIENELQLLPRGQKIHHLDKGQHVYDFELALPGDLPATFHHDIGSIVYEFKAQVDRPTFSSNYIITKGLFISRSPSTNQQFLLPQSITNEWANKLLYTIGVPSQTFNSGMTIPVTFDFNPLCQHLQIKSVNMVFREDIRFRVGNHSSTERRILTSTTDHRFTQNALPSTTGNDNGWLKTEHIQLPSFEVNDPTGLHVDLSEEHIEVSHKLKVTVALLNADKHVSELRVSIPISIIDATPEEDINALPAYEDAWRSVLYQPQITIESPHPLSPNPPTLCSRSSSASSFTSSLQSDDQEHYHDHHHSQQELDPIPWLGTDLSRVPSYRTALRSERLYSITRRDLPSYDSLCVV
ncbi:unnamed protein product [Cunninghamella echinulata]